MHYLQNRRHGLHHAGCCRHDHRCGRCGLPVLAALANYSGGCRMHYRRPCALKYKHSKEKLDVLVTKLVLGDQSTTAIALFTRLHIFQISLSFEHSLDLCTPQDYTYCPKQWQALITSRILPYHSITVSPYHSITVSQYHPTNTVVALRLAFMKWEPCSVQLAAQSGQR